MNNIPQVKLGIVAVSRDCFPMELSTNRRKAVVKSFQEKGGDIYECPTTCLLYTSSSGVGKQPNSSR